MEGVLTYDELVVAVTELKDLVELIGQWQVGILASMLAVIIVFCVFALLRM